MDELQNKYDDLDNIELSLKMLISEIKYKDYKVQLEEIMYQAQTEKEEIGPRLQEICDREEREMNVQYERSAL